MDRSPDQGAVERFYQGFSAEVGLRDWIVPNARHEQLKLLVDDLLGGRDGLRILDVGCGTGVMSDHLRRYGRVTAVDLSAPATELGKLLVPDVRFEAGDLLRLDPGGPFDVVTLFDVFEHVPRDARAGFFARLRELLADDGLVVMSTPHPGHTRWTESTRPQLMQIVDEEVEPADVLMIAAEAGLGPALYRAFDVWDRRDYQLLALEPPPARPGAPIRHPRLRRRLRLGSNPPARVLRRLPLAARLLRRGRPRAALWLVLPRGRPPKLP